MRTRWVLILVVAWTVSPSIGIGRTTAADSTMPGTIEAFHIYKPSMTIDKPAQPFTPFDKVGRKFAVLGEESGTFEAWAYPLKLFRNFEFSFYLKNSTRPIRAADIVRRISVTPAATTITYVYQSFTVRAVYVTPVSTPGAMILLSVDAVVPLKIVCGFLPVLQPMWPAGIGGQYAYWDDGMKAYIISEPTGENHGIVGSPAATGISYTPAHMLSDYPNEFTIDVADPARVRDRFIPVCIAGGEGKRDAVNAVYDSLVADPEKYYEAAVQHYAALEKNTLQIETPVRDLNLAFKWAKVAYDNLLVDNPDLGKGLVAGLGVSGTSGRPGFGWFFGGDAYINSFSMSSYGAFDVVRDALAFTEKWQRADGKMAHELSQGAGYVDWFHKYGYAYIHADTTPFYIDAVYDYYRLTGDRSFVEKSWKSLTKAYDWCLSTDSNGDGLMDNSKAGLGALEFGSLINIQSDVYLSAIWVRATYAMERLANAVGDPSYAAKAKVDYARAAGAYERDFWNPNGKYYSYAFNSIGEKVNVLTPWMSVGLSWGIGDSVHSDEALEQLASSQLTTDWGVRTISDRSSYYDPLNYNYGTVWPFITGWASVAEFRHGFSLQGYGMLMSTARHTFDNEQGDLTEVFSGASNVWLGEAVSHQGFSTGGVVMPLVRGLFGLDGDASRMRVTFAPQFPANWDSASASNYRVGEASFSFRFARMENVVKVVVNGVNADGYDVVVSPVLAPGTKVTSATLNGKPAHVTTRPGYQSVEATADGIMAGGAMTFEFSCRPTVEILPPEIETTTGDADHGLKIVSVTNDGRELLAVVEGLAGRRYSLKVMNRLMIGGVDGAALNGSELDFEIPNTASGGFARHVIRLRLQ